MDWIELDDFRINCIIGVLEREQQEPQNIEILLRLGLDLRPAAGGDLSRSVNYAEVADQTEFVAKHGRWRLLESLGAAICQLLLSDPAPQERRASVDEVEVLMRKPEILGEQATPAVRLRRGRQFGYVHMGTLAPGVEAEVLVQTEKRGAYRVQLDGGRSWCLPQGMAGLLIAGEASVHGKVPAPGAIFSADAGEVTNEGPLPLTLLVVGRTLSVA
jgi:FolB domain-containing protein